MPPYPNPTCHYYWPLLRCVYLRLWYKSSFAVAACMWMYCGFTGVNIWGPPGIGKSHFVKKLASNMLSGNDVDVIYVDCRYDYTSVPMLIFLSSWFSKLNVSADIEIFYYNRQCKVLGSDELFLWKACSFQVKVFKLQIRWSCGTMLSTPLHW